MSRAYNKRKKEARRALDFAHQVDRGIVPSRRGLAEPECVALLHGAELLEGVAGVSRAVYFLAGRDPHFAYQS